ncbi:MAG: alpha/beta fold hydrolase [Geminicoccaceae bacterium]|nr:MAG: alpha/beta fold hydrolase [Geminicoccaceae bacterium]
MLLDARIVGETGPAVVILHGLLGAGRNWQTIAEQLAAAHRVVLIDLRNHGASPWASAMRYADMADDVRLTLAHLGIERACMIGHSMGGKVVMQLALREPERVTGLVVVDIAPVTYPNDHEAPVRALQGLDLSTLRNRAEADKALAPAIPNTALRHFLLQNLVRDGGGYRWRVNLDAIARAMPTLIGFPATEAVFDGPALAIVGGQSAYVDATGEAALQARLPQVVIERLPEAGHWPHAEAPEVVTRQLRAFLRRVEEPGAA